ncbi:MAG TPA: SH3 domain-containing protein [Sedimentisphaerales bacterium]|nr:SH3 domain-containing protein [Sedimentisphaerales bacterium]
MRTRLLIVCICFGIASVSLMVMIWYGKSAPWVVTTAIAAFLTVCFLASVILEARSQSRTACGVILADEVTARQGDGPNYPKSFKEPLHAGTEFDLLERRPGWFQIRLLDGSTGWIPDDSADLI